MTHPGPSESVARWKRLAPWLLVVVGILVYVNTLPNEFVFDDTAHILQNPDIRDLSNLPAIIFSGPRWVPEVTLALNWAIDGDQPRGYHLVNMFIHILAALTLYGLVRRIVSRREERGAKSEEGRGKREGRDRVAPRSSLLALRPSLLAFAVALLWLVHPLNTQAVTYVIQRHESLMGLFYLFTLYGTVRAAGATGRAVWAWGAAAVLACALGMSTKQVMVTAPVLALLLDRAFLGGSFAAALRRRWGLYAALAATWLSFAFNGGLGGIASGDSSAGFGLKLVSWHEYLLSEGEVILHYLRLTIWPHPLVLDYLWLPAAMVEDPTYRLLHLWVPCAVVALLLAVSVFGLIRNTWWGFLGFAFFAVLSVTSSFVPIADLAMEHRMYLSLAAVIALVVVAVDRALRRWTPPREARLIGGALVAVAAIVLAGLTIQRNFEYRTGVSIWTTVTQRAPFNPRGFHNLGKSLGDKGRMDEAMAAYEHAVEMVPSYADAHHNMGNIWMQRGRPDRALERYAAAAEADPADGENRYGLAMALMELGRLDQARRQVEAAIERMPEPARGYSLRGSLRARSGDLTGAITDFEHAINLDPQLAEARYNLGLALMRSGDDAPAATALREAIRLDPDDVRPIRSLARLLATSADAAVRDGYEAIRLVARVREATRERDVATLDTLAAAYAAIGDFGRAVATVDRAIDLATRQGLPPALVEQMASRRALYEAGKPYHGP